MTFADGILIGALGMLAGILALSFVAALVLMRCVSLKPTPDHAAKWQAEQGAQFADTLSPRN